MFLGTLSIGPLTFPMSPLAKRQTFTLTGSILTPPCLPMTVYPLTYNKKGTTWRESTISTLIFCIGCQVYFFCARSFHFLLIWGSMPGRCITPWLVLSYIKINLCNCGVWSVIYLCSANKIHTLISLMTVEKDAMLALMSLANKGVKGKQSLTWLTLLSSARTPWPC